MLHSKVLSSVEASKGWPSTVNWQLLSSLCKVPKSVELYGCLDSFSMTLDSEGAGASTTYYSSPDHSKKNLELYHFGYHLRYIHAPSVHAPTHWCTSRLVRTKA